MFDGITGWSNGSNFQLNNCLTPPLDDQELLKAMIRSLVTDPVSRDFPPYIYIYTYLTP